MGEAELQGVAFLQQYVRSGEPRALDEAVTLLRRSVRETPPGTARGSCLSNLLVAVTLRCSVSDDPQDLAELVTVGRAAAAGSPTAQDLVLFGRALRRTHGRTGEPGELDEAIDVFGRGLRLSEPNDQRLSLLNDRALALLERYRRDGRAPDLAAAETDLHRALDLPDLEPVIRARTLANLATARFLHHQAGGDLAELRAAVELQRAAATACPAGVPERPAMLSGLAQFLTRAAVQGEAGAVTEGIDACRAGLALTPSGHPERPALLYRLGALLRLAVEAGERDVSVLDEAAHVAREAVHTTPASHPDLSERLHGLGNILHRLSLLARAPGLLDEAIDCLRRAAAGLVEHEWTDGDRERACANLSVALRRRHLATQDLASLGEAASLTRTLMDSAAALDRDGGALHNASAVLADWAAATGDAQAARDAVDAARAALRAAPDRPALRAERLNALANALRTRHDVSGGHAAPHGDGDCAGDGDPIARLDGDLGEAIVLLQQAVRLLPPDAPGFALTLSNLGAAWRRKAELTGDPEAAEKAVTALGRAVIAGDPWPDRRALYRSHHAAALRLLYEMRGDLGVLRAAARDFRLAARTVEASPLARAANAQAWGDAAAECEGPAIALEAYRLAVGLLPRVAPRHLARADQQKTLARLCGLASRAAASAVDAGDVRLAVQLLEQGRGTLLGHFFESRGEMAALRTVHPAAADGLTGLRDRMDCLSLDSGRAPGPTDERHALGARWDEQVARIRRLPGFADFLALPPLDDLLACTDRGPVVLLYGGPRRGDALILQRSRSRSRYRHDPHGAVRHVALPGLNEVVVQRQSGRFHDALAASRSPDEEREAGRVLDEVRAWLWDSAVGPVLDALGQQPPGPDPELRVWWSPSGALAGLPLHAAGHAGDPARTALDRVVSSYTPTLRALRHARSREGAAHEQRTTGAPAVLAVASGDAPGAPVLPGAEREVEAVRRMLPTRVLAGRQATFGAVYEALPHHPFVHFACHGLSDPSDPSASRLLVHDHAERPLTVRDISRLNLSGAQLAVLSACATSRTAGRLADEGIHITSAFQIAGYPHVVGTLWPVHDAVARRVATTFYRELRHSGEPGGAPLPDAGRAALALHRAVRECRARYPNSPSLWAAHVHAGA